MRVIGSLLCMLAWATSAYAGALTRETADFPELPPPPGGSAQWIAKSMRLNGLAMTVQSFQSRSTVDAVLRHYESWSNSRGHGETRRMRAANDQLLSIRLEPYIATIQAHAAAGRTIGTIVVSRLLSSKLVASETRFPRPATARVVNLQQFDDDGMEAEHISLISDRAPHVEAHSFAESLRDDNWVVTREQPMQHIARGYVVEAQKGSQLAALTIFPSEASTSTTAIVVVWKKT